MLIKKKNQLILVLFTIVSTHYAFQLNNDKAGSKLKRIKKKTHYDVSNKLE